METVGEPSRGTESKQQARYLFCSVDAHVNGAQGGAMECAEGGWLAFVGKTSPADAVCHKHSVIGMFTWIFDQESTTTYSKEDINNWLNPLA